MYCTVLTPGFAVKPRELPRLVIVTYLAGRVDLAAPRSQYYNDWKPDKSDTRLIALVFEEDGETV